jgi:hypothetical protein
MKQPHLEKMDLSVPFTNIMILSINSNQMRKYVTFLFLVIMAILAASCDKKDLVPPSTDELVGVYKGKYAKGIETITINADGTFTQEFKNDSGQLYISSGKWNLHNKDSNGLIQFRNGQLEFAPFMSPDGIWNGKIDGKPDKSEATPATWHRVSMCIVFVDEVNYYVNKVSGHGATAKEADFQ